MPDRMTGCSISANCHFMLIAWCSPPLCRSCWSQAIYDFPFGATNERCIWLRCVTLCHDNYTVTCHTCHTCHHPVQRWPMFLVYNLLVEGNLTIVILRTRSKKYKMQEFGQKQFAFSWNLSSICCLIRPVLCVTKNQVNSTISIDLDWF